MKYLYQKLTAALLLLLLGFNAKATSDTLTIGQVFDWSVGDTFIYKSAQRHVTFDYNGYATESNDTGRVGFVVDSRQNFTDSILYSFRYFNDTAIKYLAITHINNTIDTFDQLPDINLAIGVCNFRPEFWSTTLFSFPDLTLNNLTTDSFYFTLGDATYISAFTEKVGIKNNHYDFVYWGSHIWERYYTNCSINLVYYKSASTGYIYSDVKKIPTPAPTFLLYPNPATDELTITTQTDAPVDVFIYDMPGNCVLAHKNFRPNLGNLKVTSLTPGYYVLKLTDQHGLASSKGFIIAR